MKKHCTRCCRDSLAGTGDRFKNVRFDLIPQEIDSMFALAEEEEFEVVLGHHDLQHGNILHNAEGDMIFVDFESFSRLFFDA